MKYFYLITFLLIKSNTVIGCNKHLLPIPSKELALKKIQKFPSTSEIWEMVRLDFRPYKSKLLRMKAPGSKDRDYTSYEVFVGEQLALELKRDGIFKKLGAHFNYHNGNAKPSDYLIGIRPSPEILNFNGVLNKRLFFINSGQYNLRNLSYNYVAQNSSIVILFDAGNERIQNALKNGKIAFDLELSCFTIEISSLLDNMQFAIPVEEYLAPPIEYQIPKDIIDELAPDDMNANASYVEAQRNIIQMLFYNNVLRAYQKLD